MGKTFNEKIAAISLEMEQLENRRKQIIRQQKEADRKARTSRLCKRGGFLESILPGTIPLTDGQFETFLKKTMLTDFTRRALAAVGAENAEPAADDSAVAVARDNAAPAPKPAGTAQSGGVGGNVNGTNGARATS